MEWARWNEMMNLKHLGLESEEKGALFKIMLTSLLESTELESLTGGSGADIFKIFSRWFQGSEG